MVQPKLVQHVDGLLIWVFEVHRHFRLELSPPHLGHLERRRLNLCGNGTDKGQRANSVLQYLFIVLRCACSIGKSYVLFTEYKDEYCLQRSRGEYCSQRSRDP